jgi:predicted metalloendopeptidase
MNALRFFSRAGIKCSLAAMCLAALPAHEARSALDVADLNAAVGACTDFYAYVNGNWLERTVIPADRSRWGGFEEVSERNARQLKASLELAQHDRALRAQPALRKVADFYAAGMNEAAIERAGIGPLAQELARAARIQSRDALADTIARWHAERIEAGFGLVRVGPDDKQSSRNVLLLTQGGLGLPDRDFYLNADAKFSQWRDAYRMHIAAVLALAGDSRAVAKRKAEDIFGLEQALARASRERAALRDPNANYHLMTRDEVERSAPGFAWSRFFDALRIPRSTLVNVRQPEFFQAFAVLARDVDLSTWRAYLRWQLLREASPVLLRAFEAEHDRFYNATLKGTRSPAPRFRRVLDVISGRVGAEPMGHAAGQLFVATSFAPAAKAKAREAVDDIKAALAERIDTLDWMSDATKAQARIKLAAMDIKVGYQDPPRDYSALRIDRRIYATNWLRANRFEMSRTLAKLGRPVDRSEWFMAAHIVNAYYNPTRNEIVFPAGILQPPFFDPDADAAVNYGGIGVVIGHEITHGFDDYGRQYDAQGNLRDWWLADDARRYSERAASIEKQYGGYVAVDDLKLNGKLTLGENIADIGGLKLSFLAFQKAAARHPSQTIDGLTPEQRFFVSFAQVWRIKVRDEQARVFAVSDPHSPPRWRVTGALSHQPAFAAAFGCKTSDAMLREEESQAEVW